MDIKGKLISAMGLNVVLWLLMLIGFTGVLFCASGIYMALTRLISPFAAALFVGIAMIALVCAIVLWYLMAGSPQKKSRAKQIRENPDNLLEHQLRPVLGDQATNWAKRHTGLAVVGAMSAGVILAASPRLRSLIAGAAGPVFTRKAIQAFQQLSDNG